MNGFRGLQGAGRTELMGLAALTLLASYLLFVNLGNQFLWQDEAQTAVVARTILDHGIPLGYDGRNHFSQELGKEYAEGHVWKWHPWLSFYAVAASFAVFGVDARAARLPFALFALATVLLTYFTALRLWRNRFAAAASASVLALSVPFLIFGRQCRYYSMCSFFSLLGLYAYAGLVPGRRRGAILLLVSATLLFHSHYIYCATLFATLVLHAALFERGKLRSVVQVGLGVALLNLPWLFWLSSVRPAGDRYFASVLDFEKLIRFSMGYGQLVFDHFFDVRLLAIVLVLALWRAFAREPVFSVSRETRHGLALVLLFCVTNIVLIAALSPLLFYRYLAPLLPVVSLAIGLLLGELMRRSRVAGVAVFALWLAGGSLADHLYEIQHDFDGPIEGIVRFLEEHGREGDVVAISYGDLPLKFHTDFRVIGGLTGEDLADLPQARFVIPRSHDNTHEDRRIKQRMKALLAGSPQSYVRHELAYPDTAFENREDPRRHRFRTAPGTIPRVIVFEKVE